RDMIVHDTDQLALWFRDAPPRTQLPDKLPPARGGQAPAPPSASRPPSSTVPHAPNSKPGDQSAAGQPAPDGAKPETERPPRPMDVSAHLIEAYVLRIDSNKHELERLWTEGRVRVRQEPEKLDDKGLNIKGDTLELTRQNDGNLLVVTGKDRDVAELQM